MLDIALVTKLPNYYTINFSPIPPKLIDIALKTDRYNQKTSSTYDCNRFLPIWVNILQTLQKSSMNS